MELTTRTTCEPPAQTRSDADLLARYRNAVERSHAGLLSISDERAPAGADRRALESRLAVLEAGEGRADPQSIATRVARLFLRFPASTPPRDRQEATFAAYTTDLQNFPLWAIDKAMMACIAKGGTYAPSSPVLRGMCEQAMVTIRVEAADIRAVLNAQVYRVPPADERQRITAAFDELAKELGLRAAQDSMKPKEARPLTKVEAEAWLAEQAERAKTTPPPQFGPALRASLGLPPIDHAESDAA